MFKWKIVACHSPKEHSNTNKKPTASLNSAISPCHLINSIMLIVNLLDPPTLYFISARKAFAPVGCEGRLGGFGHMYDSARGRLILQYKINPNPNPNTNPSSPYCIMRFIFGSRVHVPLRD